MTSSEHEPPAALEYASRATPRRRWPFVLAIILFTVLGILGPLLALFGGATRSDSYSHGADRLWGLVAMIEGGLNFLTTVAAFLFLFLPKNFIRIAVFILMALALLSDGLLIWSGCGMLAEAQQRGGDWAAVGVAASLLFGIVLPAAIGVLLIGGGLCLRAAKPASANGPS